MYVDFCMMPCVARGRSVHLLAVISLCKLILHLSSNRQHLSCGDLKVNGEYYWNSSVLCMYAHQYAHKFELFLNLYLVRFRLVFVCFL